MKNYLFVSLMAVLFSIHSFAQSKRGWTDTEIISVFGGLPLSKNSNADSFFSFEFLKFSTSFGKATPFQKFGIGTELVDVSIYGKNDLVTLFPLILHFIPWMKFKNYDYQPINHEKTTKYGNEFTVKEYSYDPTKTNQEEGVSSSIELSISSTLWGFGDAVNLPDGTYDHTPLNKKYFNLRTAFVHNIRSKSKGKMGAINGRGLKIAAEINNYLILKNGKAIFEPNIGIRIVGGVFEPY